MLTDKRMDSWIAAGLNVLLVGQHGIGKTERVLQALERNKIKYLYFSASTMDPFTDFVGIPRVVETEHGKHIDFIKPKQVADGDFQYIVVDEYNRSHKKVRNAMMECVQFKSLNGVKLPNLRGVIAMINPPDDEDTYDVEKLDPAQEDRFHIKVTLPNGPAKDYFKSKHGELGEIAVNWWQTLDAKLRQKGLVSPRRLEYAVELYKKNIDIEDVLPKEVNIKQLKTELAKAGLSSKLPELKRMKAEDLKKELAGNGNLRELVLSRIFEGDFPSASLDAFSDEEITPAIEHAAVTNHIIKQIGENNKRYLDIAQTVSSYVNNNAKKAYKDNATAIAKQLLIYEQNKIKKASEEERRAGMSLEDVKRKLGELAKPTVDAASARKTIEESLAQIKKEAALQNMLARISDIRPIANIRQTCLEFGVKLPA